MGISSKLSRTVDKSRRWLTTESLWSSARRASPPDVPSRRHVLTRSSSSSVNMVCATSRKCGGPRSAKLPVNSSLLTRRIPSVCSKVTHFCADWSVPESRMKLDYVLSLKVEDFLERRLQTQVFKLGLAKSIHQARVLIRQRHIRVRKQLVNIPSFIVRLDSQKPIDFALRSPFGGGRAGRVKRKNSKKGTGGEEAEDDDE